MELDPRAFLSFDFDYDEPSRRLFGERSLTDSPTRFVVHACSRKEELGTDRWEDLLSTRLSLCHLMVVLVGLHTGTARGVAMEIDVARANGVPYFGVYVDGADTSTKLPPGLPRNRTIVWNWNAIGTAIDRMMTEGKNAG